MQPPSKILYWCGPCRGERPHRLARVLAQHHGAVTLYGCACGAAPVEISEPGDKAVGVITAKRAADAALLGKWHLECLHDGVIDDPRTSRAELPSASEGGASDKETTMTLKDAIAAAVAEALEPLEARVKLLEDQDIPAIITATLLNQLGGGEQPKPRASSSGAAAADFKCPRRPHRGKCPSAWCRKAAARE